MDQLVSFLSDNRIHYVTPQSSDYADLRAGFIINATPTPAIIVRPRSAEDVAALVSVLVEHNITFTVRTGGHDMFGRSQIQDGVTIDMREIAHVHVDRESQTARMGGGVIVMDVLRELRKYGMTTPHGMTPSVGYVGWATHGGYGLLSAKYGLGVDQIVGATVVDAKGAIREADETMLTGLRGGGGSLGVIVEIKIKVYPLDKILAGAIIYQPNDVAASIRQFNQSYQQQKAKGIPSALNLYQSVATGPEGKSLSVFFIWASEDLEEGWTWLSKVCLWAPLATNTVTATTVADFNEYAAALIPKSTYGSIFAINVQKLTPEILEIISEHTALQPCPPPILFGIHELRTEAPQSPAQSVFATRSPHFLIEIIPMTASAEALADVLSWGQNFYDALMKTDPENISKAAYLPLTKSQNTDLRVAFGSQYETLKKIKEVYDPSNVFKHSLVQF